MAKAVKRGMRRPFIDAAQAAALLGCDPRTIRRSLEAGELEGYSEPRKKQRRWFVYSDQPGIQRAMGLVVGPTAEETRPSDMHADRLALEVAELRAHKFELRAQTAEARARNAEAQNAHLVAALHVMNDVLGEFQKSGELAQKSGELARASNAHLQSGAAMMSKVMGTLLDSLSASNTPDSPEGLEDRGETSE